MSYRVRFASFGALFGLAFPLVALNFDAWTRGLGWGIGPLIELHRVSPLHFIIDVAPLILAYVASLAGRREDRIRLHAAELEDRVHERTAELESALVQAQSAERAKTEFLTNTSHELRTPMNAILGFAEILADSPLTPEQQDYLGTIRRSGESLLALLEDILDLGRIESGEFELEECEVELEWLVHEVAELVRLRVADRPVELIVDVGEEVPRLVHGDPTRVRQTLMNLVGNAAKFTEAGSIRIRVRGEGLLPSRSTGVTIEVIDTGIGIPPDRIDAIFGRFCQVDASTTRKFGGTGLGLTITRHLTELMGGKLTVESREGEGATFHLELPLKPAERGASADSSRRDNASFGAVRALVVDDLPEARTVTSRCCRRLGIDHEVVESGQAALAALERSGGSIGLIISDILMPEMDGMDLARAIRGLPDGDRYRLLAVSSWVCSGSAEAFREAGFDAFVSKPLRFESFRGAIRSLLGHSDPVDTVPAGSGTDAPVEGARRTRILLAEDNEVNRKLAEVVLSKIGATIASVGNGREAVEAVRDGDFDLVLMDVQMPQMSGLEATRVLRSQGCVVPIIAMTANAMKGDREECLEAGMNDYLSKPVQRAVLLEAIRKHATART
ncbi:response regulator [bacterium]|nr:response regulator [bacterium]